MQIKWGAGKGNPQTDGSGMDVRRGGIDSVDAIDRAKGEKEFLLSDVDFESSELNGERGFIVIRTHGQVFRSSSKRVFNRRENETVGVLIDNVNALNGFLLLFSRDARGNGSRFVQAESCTGIGFTLKTSLFLSVLGRNSCGFFLGFQVSRGSCRCRRRRSSSRRRRRRGRKVLREFGVIDFH